MPVGKEIWGDPHKRQQAAGATRRPAYLEDAGGKTLPTNRYYVMSDNRTQFSDSRNDEIGLVEADNIVGKARWVIWPLSHLGGL